MSERSLIKQYGLVKLTERVVIELMDVWDALSPILRKIITSKDDFILYAEASLSSTGIKTIDKALRDGEPVEWSVRSEVVMNESIVKSDNQLIGYTQRTQTPSQLDVKVSYKIRGIEGKCQM